MSAKQVGLVTSSFTAGTTTQLNCAKDTVLTITHSHSSGFYYAMDPHSGGEGWVKKTCVTLGHTFLPTANYEKASEDELSLTSGIKVIGFAMEESWWFGQSLNGSKGYFPGTFVSTPEPSPPIPPSTARMTVPNPTAAAKPASLPLPSKSAPPPLRGKSKPPAPPKQATKQAARPSDFKTTNPMQAAPAAVASPAAAPAASTPAGAPSSDTATRPFKGSYPLQFLLWGNNMALASSLWLTVFGFFTILWATPPHYGCKINGVAIHDIYLEGNETQPSVLCDPTLAPPSINGDKTFGSLALVYGVLMFIYEQDGPFGWGCYYPSDSFAFTHGVSLRGVFYILTSLPLFAKFPAALAASFLLPTGVVVCYGVRRKEAGDGGRAAKAKRAAAMAGRPAPKKEEDEDPVGYNPVKFYKKIVNENKLSAYFWVFVFLASNLITFAVTLAKWVTIVSADEQALISGTLDTICAEVSDTCVVDQSLCLLNRVKVLHGPVSKWGPYAKACGMCLNFNCSLIIYPVARLLLRRLNNAGVSFSNRKNDPSVFSKIANDITRVIPLSKNIDFHKLVAKVMCFFAVSHTIFHFFNYWLSSHVTLQTFTRWGWGGSAFFSGAVICFSMFFIFTAASDTVRHSHYEIFFSAHHWFILYFSALLLHGRIYWQWSAVPLSMYIIERIMQTRRGAKPYYVNKVDMIGGVMSLYFRPVFKPDFVFKEGQYLYLNCPALGVNEWHPFTISSAYENLTNGPKVCLQTGEEVFEVPRPSNVGARDKWNKFCVVSKDHKQVKPSDYLDRHEVGYNDFVSCHIKIHGMDVKAEPGKQISWTRRLKEYLEQQTKTGTFPQFFNHTDERGDLVVGKQFGRDGMPLLRVDGPHAAPAEHYSSYGTVMIIGAGIGLTPCASILQSLLKFKWKKGFTPEILHFYWLVPQGDVDAFQWLVHMITDLQHGLKHQRETKQVGAQYYCEINIYITSAKKEPIPTTELEQAEKTYANAFTKPAFHAKQLHDMMMNPSMPSKKQVEVQNGEKSRSAPNRLGDVFVWNGRPQWDAIFEHNREQRQHESVGVCFCGAPVIGRDLQRCCQKYSSVEEDILFNLHKENF